jgi:hypothetical protein
MREIENKQIGISIGIFFLIGLIIKIINLSEV